MKESMFSAAAAKRQMDQAAKIQKGGIDSEEPLKKYERVNISLSTESRKKLQILADRNETTVSQLIRSWINEKYNSDK